MKSKLTIHKGSKKLASVFSIFIILSAFFFSFVIVRGDELSSTLVYIDPLSQIVSPGQTFSISVYCSPGQPIKSYEFKISFNASLLQANSVTEGDIFDGYQTYFNSGSINNTSGKIIDVYGLILGQGNVTDPGTFATISFTAKTSLSTTLLHLYDTGVTDETGYISIVTNDGNVTIYSSDTLPAFFEVTPDDESTNTPTSTSSLSIKIQDPKGNPFNWTITTSPNVGSSSGNNESNGTKTCSISGLSYGTTYTWYVNCKDTVNGLWTNESYWFKTEEAQSPGGGGSPPGGGGGITPPPIIEQNTPPNQPTEPEGPTLIERGVTYEYSSYTTDTDGDTVRFMFDWGDGNYSNWSNLVTSNTTVSMSHYWDSISNFIIKVLAQDKKGLNSTWSEPLVVIISEAESGDEPPYMEILTPDNMVSNQTVFFDASGSYDLNGVIVSYYWDFGDGENENGTNATTTHIYRTPGYYTVTLVVTDNDGDTYNTSISVNVLSQVAEGNLQQETDDPFPIFTIIPICIFIIIISLVVLYRDKIILFLLDKRLNLLRRKEVSDVKNKLHKSVGKEKRINYYSTVTNPPFSVKRDESSKDIQDYYLRKERLIYDIKEIIEEPKPRDEYDELNVGEKVDKLVSMNLKPYRVDDHTAIDTIGNIEKIIDNLDFIILRKKIDRL